MAFEPATKAYTKFGVDYEKVYRERRAQIRTKLPAMSAIDLLRRLKNLDGEISDFKEEAAKLEDLIRQVKHEGSASSLIDGFERTFTSHNISVLELRLDTYKTALKWMQQERKIYAWEIRLRKAKGVKLPVLKIQRGSLNKEAYKLLCKMKGLVAQFAAYIEAYRHVADKLNNVEEQIKLLDFYESEHEPTGGNWTRFNMPEPREALRSFSFLDNLELKVEE